MMCNILPNTPVGQVTDQHGDFKISVYVAKIKLTLHCMVDKIMATLSGEQECECSAVRLAFLIVFAVTS